MYCKILKDIYGSQLFETSIKILLVKEIKYFFTIIQLHISFGRIIQVNIITLQSRIRVRLS